MTTCVKTRSAHSRLLAAVTALPSFPAFGLAAATFALASSGLMAQTTIGLGYNAFSTETTLNLGTLTRDPAGAAFFSGAGTISASSALSAGILGPWAFSGTGTSTRYATLSAGNIAALTATTAATGFGWPSGNGNTFNYDVSAVQGNLGVGRQGNTARYTGVAGTQNWGNNNTTAVTLNGLMNAGTGTLTFGEAGGTSQGVLAIGTNNGNELVLSAANANIAINIPIANTGANAGSLLVTGPNTVQITSSGGASTYTGATTVASGVLNVSGAGDINSTSGITVKGPATYSHTSSVASTRTITLTQGTVGGTGTLATVNVADSAGAIIANGAGTLTIGNLTFNGDATLNATVPVGAKALNVTGPLVTTPAAGTVTLNLSSSGWANGTTNVVGFGSFAGSLSDFTLGTVGGLNARQSAGSLSLNSGNLAIQINGDTPKWTGAQNGNWTTTPVGGAGNWRLVGAGSVTDFITADLVLFDDSATGTTAVTISDANVSPGGVEFNNSTKTYTVSSPGGFGLATGSLTKNGSGTVILTTTNAYPGPTTINAGVLQIGDGVTDGSITASASIANQGALAFNLVGSPTYSSVISGSGSVTKQGAGVLTLSGANTYSGGTVVQGGKLVAPVTSLNGGPIQIDAGATLTLTGNNLISTSAVSGAGALLHDTANTIILAGDHSGFTGTLTHSSGTNNTQFSTAASGSAAAVYTLTAGEFVFAANGDYTVSLGSLASTAGAIRGGNVATGITTLQVGARGENTAIAGNFNNGTTKVLALTKVGNGSLTINGANSFGGGTRIESGALIVNGSLTSTVNAVAVSAGASLEGTGTIAGAVTSSGLIAPASAGIGTLTLQNSVTLEAGSTTQFQINKTAATADRLAITGALALAGTLHVTNLDGSLAAGDSFTLFSAGSITGSFANVALPSLGSGLVWETAALDTSGTITVAAAPSGYGSWAAGYAFPSGQETVNSDPDADGLPNAVEWLLGGEPLASDIQNQPTVTVRAVTTAEWPSAVAGQRYLTLTARVRKDLGDATLVPQASASLTTLDAVESSSNIVSFLVADLGDFEQRTWVYTVPVTTGGRAFMRLKIVMP